MNPKIGWALAVAAVTLGYVQYGWMGVLMAVSAIVFWLLLQFTRALRAMRAAGGAPIGAVASAVMLHAKLKVGMRLMDIIQLTRSLGEKLDDEPERYRWTDGSGASVTVDMQKGLCTRWALRRPEDAPGDGPVAWGSDAAAAGHEADADQAGQHQRVGLGFGHGRGLEDRDAGR
jgi:hypothetical protein